VIHAMITAINSVNFIHANVLDHPQFVAFFEDVAARSTAWVCGRSLFGNAGSNPARSMNVCLL
jgi:hypothetical protein